VIAGHDVLREPDKVRAKIGLAGQSVTMDKYRERPGEPDDDRPLYRFSRRDAGLRSQELIAHFDLAPAADRPVSTYSGGMRRRLDLAASLMAAPPVRSAMCSAAPSIPTTSATPAS
jgi:ABC-2 type transport system ATP-binding protein